MPANLAGGTYNVTVRGTSGTVTADAVTAVTVVEPAFSLTATPTSVSVTSGTTTAAVSIGVVPVGGFGTGTAVALTCPGAPSGITCGAATATASAAGNLVMTLPAGLGYGTYNVTVQGSGGGKTATRVVPVQMGPTGSFTLSLSPAAGTASQGTTAVSTLVTVTGAGGWPAAAPVALSCPGAPAGITCAGTTSGASPGLVTMTLPANLALGSYTVPVVGTLAPANATVNYVLTVSGPRSVRLVNGATASGSLAGDGALNGRNEWRLEYRLHDFASTSNATGVFTIGNEYDYTTKTRIYAFLDGTKLYNCIHPAGTALWFETELGTATDVVVRVQRPNAGNPSQVSVQVWNRTSGTLVPLTTTPGGNGTSITGVMNFADVVGLGTFWWPGATAMNGSLAFLRLYPGVVASTAPFSMTREAGALVGFEFENGLADSINGSRILTPGPSGTLSYVNTP